MRCMRLHQPSRGQGGRSASYFEHEHAERPMHFTTNLSPEHRLAEGSLLATIEEQQG